jgi:hypothetical protein
MLDGQRIESQNGARSTSAVESAAMEVLNEASDGSSRFAGSRHVPGSTL